MLPSGLVVFDVDGTLLRGPTVCELIATAIGRSERMAELELGGGAGRDEAIPAREEMAGWYMEVGRDAIMLNLDNPVVYTAGILTMTLGDWLDRPK